MLTDDELNKIEKRANAATNGPWGFASHKYPEREDGYYQIGTHSQLGKCMSKYILSENGNVRVALSVKGINNCEFISKSRTDVPRLVAEVRRLNKLVEAADEIIKISEKGYPGWLLDSLDAASDYRKLREDGHES